MYSNQQFPQESSEDIWALCAIKEKVWFAIAFIEVQLSTEEAGRRRNVEAPLVPQTLWSDCRGLETKCVRNPTTSVIAMVPSVAS